ncbi:hypothetical protein RHGRI_015891 [Rhododendron griersonianum]|uniref:FAD-binding domain-containing protein n=1 Tax=Rhododendron griersonianum TaxID=479676 RepID=A0AAV6JQJ2_9ERIC|nr:hypothetical protein RHGRI_015891 [Rhododendron griersonianum]
MRVQEMEKHVVISAPYSSMREQDMEEHIVIVGGGIAGPSTALGLNSMQVRTTELSVGIIRELKNYWFCNYFDDQRLEGTRCSLGIGNSLREHYPLIFQFSSWFFCFRGYESRCVRRKELLETLERELPHGTIRYSSKVVSIEGRGYHKFLHLADGSTLKAKALIGCDGVHSLVAFQ